MTSLDLAKSKMEDGGWINRYDFQKTEIKRSLTLRKNDSTISIVQYIMYHLQRPCDFPKLEYIIQ